MHKPDQPQTTRTATSRDAAAQIGAEELTKSQLIIRGSRIEREKDRPTYGDSYSLGVLAYIVEMLTSPKKDDRETGKRMVRNLVKLAEGE